MTDEANELREEIENMKYDLYNYIETSTELATENCRLHDIISEAMQAYITNTNADAARTMFSVLAKAGTKQK